jgi:hypothetical protein
MCVLKIRFFTEFEFCENPIKFGEITEIIKEGRTDRHHYLILCSAKMSIFRCIGYGKKQGEYTWTELNAICEEKGWTIEDAHACKNYALRRGIRNGNHASVEWMVNRFPGFTIDDARTCGNSALLWGIVEEHYTSVAWLVWYFGMYEDLEKVEKAEKEKVLAIISVTYGRKMVKAALK